MAIFDITMEIVYNFRKNGHDLQNKVDNTFAYSKKRTQREAAAITPTTDTLTTGGWKRWYELNPQIRIDMIGCAQNLCNLHPERRSSPFWILVLLDKGQRTLIADNEEIRISPREFFLLPPHTRQLPLEMDEHTACFVHFYTEGNGIPAPETIDASRLILPMVGRLPDNLDCFMHLRFLYEHSISPYADDRFISGQLYALLSIISLHCQKHSRQVVHGETFIDTCLGFIRDHADRSVCSADYEEALGLSYHRINQKFKNEFGLTVKQYHHRLRMKHAAQLIQSGISIEQVAEQCGYDDYYFFIKSFMKEHGVTPRAFRAIQGM